MEVSFSLLLRRESSPCSRLLRLRFFHWLRAAMTPRRGRRRPADAESAALLPRNTVVPVSVMTQHFPDVTKESSTGLNETSVGKPAASRSVVFQRRGKKKVTLSVDQYANVSDAAAAYQTAVQASKAAPGFKPASSPNLGQEAFAGTSQVGAEMRFDLGARDGRLIMSATHAGDIALMPDEPNSLISLGT